MTYGGNVRVRNVGGTVEVNTLGGNVVFDNVRPGAGASGGEPEVKVSTHGGNITVPDAPFGADLETNGGNILVEHAASYVRAKTKGGNIDILAVDGWIRATTFGGNITAVMVGDPARGKRDVRLESKGGDVSLTVPEGLSMDVDITIAYTKSSRQNFGIRSDYPLEIRRSDTWDYGRSAPRKYIYGTGTFGGGGNRIKIETVNGDVRLIEER